ncbi:MAG: DUF2184 domain-containing protein [Elusimicrobiales bacterium]|uniref:major capsid family protein n=1 Tax=Candidatus Avelusimicrobium sp. TaxID=3048833 RepID=UPI001B650345|nr:DUF2184 domain-containing protein [Elusimicrobiaceae bacterium]MDO5764089.1 DUF2184 domain-containing protein [Elusimicrobiales bacterium]
MNETQIIQRFSPSQCRPFAMDAGTKDATLTKLGIGVSQKAIADYRRLFAQDDTAPAGITTPSIATPVQFLQWWNPEIVEVATVPTDADEIIGKTTAGTFADEEIVQPIVEHIGQAHPYGDMANPRLASWNVNFEARTIVRFEESMEVGILEEERAAKMRLSSAKEKRAACATALKIERNLIAYNGFSDGTNKTYGLLNDPNLPAYVDAAKNAANTSTQWADKTFLEIQADVLSMIAGLQNSSKGLYNPKTKRATLTVSLGAEQYMNKTSDYGVSVAKWLAETYPLITVKSTVFLNDAHGGDNVAYLVADETNGNKVIDQYVPEEFRFLGVFNKGKSYEEFFANATAGVMVRQPIGVYRLSGI